MPLYEGGPLTPFSAFNAGVIPNDVFGVAINWFVNRTPLVSRLPKLPTGAPQFLITNDNYRPRSNPMNNGGTLASAASTVTVADGSIFDTGDVVQIENEYILVTAISGNVLTVTRGYAGTAAASHNDALPVYLVSNSRTGAELNIQSVSRIPQAVTQYCQTVQHAYQVGGSLQSDVNYATGFATPLDRDRMLAIQHVMDDFESACYYGKGVGLSASTSRPLMKGIFSLLQTNNVASPTNAAAYKPSDLIRDTLQACFNGGGNPSVLLVSTDFLSGMAVWGHAAMRLNAGSNVFGTPIDLFEAPFLSGISIIPAPLLRPGTAICLSDSEVRIRLKRAMIDKPRGSRGDAFEGDIIMEGAVEVDNEAHHACVSGVTAFAAS
ncbi:hypothetical protein OJF2_72620 [Aquisphaera giovannonii]|uniref:Phage capsid family protein n=1 Tax=Aquisphaera giovannonii TaxID=406548 RepID=A0A5B9WDG4_9BACT|nr:DUF5309 family protein [Aquisphaera giovannonii]QEH38656.1 hypothetical protein OJF2_72620 [Aquisphaera giovannonii]